MRIDENTIIGDLLDIDGDCETVFLSMGMPCMGCPASRGETLKEASDIHGIDHALLLQKLRSHFETHNP